MYFQEKFKSKYSEKSILWALQEWVAFVAPLRSLARDFFLIFLVDIGTPSPNLGSPDAQARAKKS